MKEPKPETAEIFHKTRETELDEKQKKVSLAVGVCAWLETSLTRSSAPPLPTYGPYVSKELAGAVGRWLDHALGMGNQSDVVFCCSQALLHRHLRLPLPLRADR